ncbi:DUF1992 domain-containing protein [Streptomyces sp. NPDC059248]|uniref:DnaJ family domain-containing protein n=1 Tax=Streptomyces sp. NPDC059248 TaxID=3346791 RepID=UPI0036ABFDA9
MTERKPPGMNFESWVDRQIRDAERRGEFASLPGAGEPLPSAVEAPYDENWWIKRKLEREGFASLPPTLALRKEVEDVLDAAWAAPTEAAACRLVEKINPRIRQMMLRPPPGPPLGLKPFDLGEIAREWRTRRTPPGGA